jgi:hypothetical protein
MTRSRNHSVPLKANSGRVQHQNLGNVHLLSRKQKISAVSHQPVNEPVAALSAVGPTPDF